jgi:hypothetical protein
MGEDTPVADPLRYGSCGNGSQLVVFIRNTYGLASRNAQAVRSNGRPFDDTEFRFFASLSDSKPK